VQQLAPHDYRRYAECRIMPNVRGKAARPVRLPLRHNPRTCAQLCHAAGGELEQIQFLLGHVSVEPTERYQGGKQRLRHAVNDTGLEPRDLVTGTSVNFAVQRRLD
jgi:hypothetical protein